MSDTKKYYWLKLKRDFFKRHDMKIIESMDNGKDYVLFYLKLLLESVDHDGSLRFSETVPYNDKMLSTITDTNIDIVRAAVKIFSELGMMDQFDDGTLYMTQVSSMLGSETSEAIRLREIRAKKKQVLIGQGESVQRTETYEKRTPELELEKDIELDKEIKKDDKFLIFYQNYPKKTNKTDAMKTFNKLIKSGITLDYILSKLKVYEKQIFDDKTETKYIRNPQRFLNTLEDFETTEKKDVKPKEKTCPKCGSVVNFGMCSACGIIIDAEGKEVIL